MGFEDLINEVGSFGRYQKILCFGLVPLGSCLCALTFYSQLFILETPKHVCRDRDPQYSQEWNNSIGWEAAHQTVPGDNFTCSPTCSQMDNSTSTLQCSKCTNRWIYDYKELHATIVSENNWVCQDSWKPTAIVSSFWASNTIGIWTYGILSDKFGRKLAIQCCFLIYGLSSIASAFFENFWVFLILRSIVGFGHVSVSQLTFTLAIEHCGHTSRVIPLLAVVMAYTLGSMITPLLALEIWNWKMLILVNSIPALFIIAICWWLPESPSWLLVHGRREQGFQQLEIISKVNGNHKTVGEIEKVYDRLCKPLDASKSTEESILQVWKFPRLRQNVLLALFSWACCCFCYYGHCMNTSKLGSNIFISYFLGSSMELSTLIVPYGINKFGRKKPLTISLLITGGFGFLYIVAADWNPYAALGMALIARIAVSCAYYISVQFCPEVFPTVVRGQGLAVAGTFGSVGSFLAPLVLTTARSWKYFPMVIFSVVAIIVGLVTCFLPETGKQDLPQTLQDGESFGMGNTNRKSQIFIKNAH